jgi:hypothetical protein
MSEPLSSPPPLAPKPKAKTKNDFGDNMLVVLVLAGAVLFAVAKYFGWF